MGTVSLITCEHNMEIKGKVYCFFEQSGTFKNEFLKLGYPAEDYDIQNDFGQTDHVMDLFQEIENAYDNKPSIFDGITNDDFIIAFFPCIYFSPQSQINFLWSCKNYKEMTMKQKTDIILQRAKTREYFYSVAVKMLAVAEIRKYRLVMENPWTEPNYLKTNFVVPPSLVDTDRTKRGDFYTKPTAYWFINCSPTQGFSFQRPTERKTILASKKGSSAGICSEDRSMISTDYARNFICDFIIGKAQKHGDIDIFAKEFS